MVGVKMQQQVVALSFGGWLAERRLDADAKKAKVVIEAGAVEMLTTLVSGLLESAEAKSFLELMPSPEGLMPPIEVGELESLSTSWST